MKTPWIRFFASDWLAGTRGMSAAETGIYITLVATMYERGEPIPEDHDRLSRLCGASIHVFKKAIDTLIKDGKILRVEGGIWNQRVEKERDRSQKKSELAELSANKRWNKKSNKTNVNSDANALRTLCDDDANQNQNQKEEDSSLRSEAHTRKNSSSRGMRIPEDFDPDIEFAVSAGLSVAQANSEADKFRDYWTAKAGRDATKNDWPATWRNWVRNAKPHPPPRGPPLTRSQQHQQDVRRNLEGVINGTRSRDDEREFAGTTIDL